MEIRSKKELKFYIMADRMMNRSCFKYSFAKCLKNIFFPDYIMLFLQEMRKLSYYKHLKGLARILAFWHKYKYRKLSLRLGFSIGCDCFGYGLVIPHYGTIVVGHSNRIGNYAVLHTSICITDNSKVIGDGLYCSTGVKMTSFCTLGDYVSIGANSLVNKSFASNVMIAGLPATNIKYASPWWERDGESYIDAVAEVERLRIKMGL